MERNLIALIDDYDKSVSQYKDSPENLLKLLLIRSEIQNKLKEHPESAIRLLALDEKFKKLDLDIPDDYRDLFHPPNEHWWWFVKTQHRWDKLDWLWNALSLGVLTAAGAVLVDTFTKLLILGPDIISSLMVGSQSILAAIAIQGSLTKKGHDVLESFFKKLGLPRYLWKESQLFFSIFCLTIVIMVHDGFLPHLSNHYTSRGIFYYEAGNLFQANERFERAFQLDESNIEAVYYLGLVQEFYNLDDAIKHYKVALQSGYIPAYNNLGRILIKQGELETATTLLWQGLRELDKIESNSQASEWQEEDELIEYYLLKNLGWVRFEQKRYKEAKSALESAIAIVADEKTAVAAYCLLAQVLENLRQNPQLQWQICLAYATEANPDEDIWVHKARQFYQQYEQNLFKNSDNESIVVGDDISNIR